MLASRVAIFADGCVGESIIKYLMANNFGHVKYVVTAGQHLKIANICNAYGFNAENIFCYDEIKSEDSEKFNIIKQIEVDYIFLSWWPFIIKENIIALSKIGVLNFHPSYLPYNRGKHYNFWNLVEDVPFGVSLHFVDKDVDSGDVIFQKSIPKTWEDNGGSLFKVAQKEIVDLFINNYKKIILQDFVRTAQDSSLGSFHYAKELEPASEIDLNKDYVVRDFFNLIRARTFDPHPSCYFYKNNKKFGVTICIKKCESKNKGKSILLNAKMKAGDLLKNIVSSYDFCDDGQKFMAILTIRSIR